MQTLTDQLLRSLRAPNGGGRAEITDARCPGLVVRVTPEGTKTFSFRFRDPRTRRVLRFNIGSYPDVRLSAARQRADELRGQVAAGTNPVEVRQRERETAASRSFGAVAERYLVERARRHNAPSYARESSRNLKKHILPRWKSRHIDGIGRADVVELIEDLIAAGKPTLANRVHALVSVIFSFAVDAGLTANNPCARLRKRGVETAATRVLCDAEIKAFWPQALQSPVSSATGLALRLVLLTGCRPGEVAGMRRSEIEHLDDSEQAIWVIPGARTKNGRAHSVPLVALARRSILAALEMVPQDRDEVFPSRSRRGGTMRPHSLSVGMARMAEKIELGSWKEAPPAPHDLRRTFRTNLSALGIAKDVRDRLMNHAPTDVGERHYDRHEFISEKRAALNAWADRLAEIVGPGAV